MEVAAEGNIAISIASGWARMFSNHYLLVLVDGRQVELGNIIRRDVVFGITKILIIGRLVMGARRGSELLITGRFSLDLRRL